MIEIRQERGDHVACVRVDLTQVGEMIAALEVWRAMAKRGP